jgi:hypothetical protein
MKIHKLESGATVITTSNHEFAFSDGTVAEPQTKEVWERLTLERKFVNKGAIKGMPLNQTHMCLNEEQQVFLSELCKQADIILIPFPVLTALREQGIRDKYPNAVSFNSTKETQRASLDYKVVDINNWSY